MIKHLLSYLSMITRYGFAGLLVAGMLASCATPPTALAGLSAATVTSQDNSISQSTQPGSSATEAESEPTQIPSATASVASPSIDSDDALAATATPMQTLPTATNVPTQTIATQPVSGTQTILHTVFLIVMENHDWSQILGSPSAPYINQTLLPQASYAQQYFNPPDNHPSEPNYLWLEAGTNFGISNDEGPSNNMQDTHAHLAYLLDQAGISWKAYLENISGNNCPLTGTQLYAPEHNPFIFFSDVTNGNDPNSAYCIQHERPFSELSGNLKNNQVARYNFIVPNRCDDMHNQSGCATNDSVKNGDTWLSQVVPEIQASQAYKNGGVILVTWDEAAHGDGPVGMIVLSPDAKGGGYNNSIHYTHSSTLRTVEEIFGVKPFLGDAAKAQDLSDLFKSFP